MTRPWRTIESVATPEGLLELRRRGGEGEVGEFLIVIGGRVLMTSSARRSEEDLARLACGEIAGRARPRVLIGGLGMGFTLRAALDALPGAARVVVAEITPRVEAWCRGPMAGLTGGAVADPRVTVRIGDVAQVIAAARPGEWDAIILDLYEGPNAATQRGDDPFYGREALARAHRAIAAGGVLAIWSEDPDAAFEKRFAAAGFAVSIHRSGRGGRTHLIYVGKR